MAVLFLAVGVALLVLGATQLDDVAQVGVALMLGGVGAGGSFVMVSRHWLRVRRTAIRGVDLVKGEVLSSPQGVLLHELGCYYHADELELFIHDGLDEQADKSGKRMVRILGDRAVEVAELMRELAADPAHPLFGTIEISTLYSWNGDPYSWARFQQFAQRMSDSITKATSGRP